MPKYRRGSRSIYRRGKTWWISYYDEGKQRWESAETSDKAKARDKLNIKLWRGLRREGTSHRFAR